MFQVVNLSLTATLLDNRVLAKSGFPPPGKFFLLSFFLFSFFDAEGGFLLTKTGSFFPPRINRKAKIFWVELVSSGD